MAIIVDNYQLTNEASATTSRWFPLNYNVENFTATIGLTKTSAAVIDYRVEYTLDASAINAGTTPVVNGFLVTDIASATAFRYTFPVVATRVVLSAAASGGTSPPAVRIWIVQNDV